MNAFGSDHLGVYVCQHIFENTRSILLVSHADGDWQFLCGGDDHSGDVPQVVGVKHLLDRDSTLAEVADLPEDFDAERRFVGGGWMRRQTPSDS